MLKRSRHYFWTSTWKKNHWVNPLVLMSLSTRRLNYVLERRLTLPKLPDSNLESNFTSTSSSGGSSR